MGVLTDFVIATDEQARSGLTDIPDNTEDRVEVRGAVPVMILYLDHVLSGTPLEEPTNEAPLTVADLLTGLKRPAQAIGSLPLIFEDEHGGACVHRIPRSLVTRLTTLNEIALAETATRWAKSVQAWEWDISSVRALLETLVSLARKALATKKNLHIWMCP
jgi:hypothetical protein